MDNLPILPEGVKLRGADFNRLARASNEGRVVAVDGMESYASASGVSLFKRQGFEPKVYKANLLPWRMDGFIDTGPVAKIRVAPGMVNNFIPTIDGASLVAVPAPALTVSGASGTIYLDATVDAAGNITALIIANATAIPADTSTQKRKLIGTWTASGGAFTNVASVLNANQTLYLCNGTAIWEA